MEKKKLLESRIAHNKKKIRDTKKIGNISPQALKDL